MGAWIETSFMCGIMAERQVAPCVGAWIETVVSEDFVMVMIVAPCVGAWIETVDDQIKIPLAYRRPLRGGVD